MIRPIPWSCAIAFDGVSLIYKTTDGGTSWSPIGGDLPATRSRRSSGSWSTQRSRRGSTCSRPTATGRSIAAYLESGQCRLAIHCVQLLALSGSALFVAAGGYESTKQPTVARAGLLQQWVSIDHDAAPGVGRASMPRDIFDKPGFSGHRCGRDVVEDWALSVPASIPTGDFAVSRQSDSQLYAASLHGLATSSDGGASWTFHPNNGLLDASVKGYTSTPSTLPSSTRACNNLGYKSLDRGAHGHRSLTRRLAETADRDQSKSGRKGVRRRFFATTSAEEG